MEEATVKSGGEPLSELIRSGAGGSRRKRPGVVPCLCVPPAAGMEPFPLPSSVPKLFWSCCWLPCGAVDNRLARPLVATLSGGRDEGAFEPLENQIEAAFRYAAATASQPPKKVPLDSTSRVVP